MSWCVFWCNSMACMVNDSAYLVAINRREGHWHRLQEHKSQADKLEIMSQVAEAKSAWCSGDQVCDILRQCSSISQCMLLQKSVPVGGCMTKLEDCPGLLPVAPAAKAKQATPAGSCSGRASAHVAPAKQATPWLRCGRSGGGGSCAHATCTGSRQLSDTPQKSSEQLPCWHSTAFKSAGGLPLQQQTN